VQPNTKRSLCVASHVIFVVGCPKLVKDINDGIQRIRQHSVPLENERAKIAYGAPGTSLNKILLFSMRTRARVHAHNCPQNVGY